MFVVAKIGVGAVEIGSEIDVDDIIVGIGGVVAVIVVIVGGVDDCLVVVVVGGSTHNTTVSIQPPTEKAMIGEKINSRKELL